MVIQHEHTANRCTVTYEWVMKSLLYKKKLGSSPSPKFNKSGKHPGIQHTIEHGQH
jgi:hypothetical protein